MARYIEANGHRCLDDEDPPRSSDSPMISHTSSGTPSLQNATSTICTKMGTLKMKAQSAFVSLKDRFHKVKTN